MTQVKTMKLICLKIVFVTLVFTFIIPASALAQGESRRDERIKRLAERRLENAGEFFFLWRHVGRIGIDSIHVQRHNQLLTLYINPNVTHIPLRESLILSFDAYVKHLLGRRFRNYELELVTRERSIIEFVPNYHRSAAFPADSSRIRKREGVQALVQRSGQSGFPGGLTHHHIALWHSHGYYYHAAKDRWQWQRARLFGTIEDLFPMEYVLGYLAPMLENAGANVFIPRDRDIQPNEVIVDWDGSSGNSILEISEGEGEWQILPGGFVFRDTLYERQNPFVPGSHMAIKTNKGATLKYIPEIPEDGEYAVYFSWARSESPAEDVQVKVHYAGGSAGFTVNQEMGHGTWIYLGKYFFRAGVHPQSGSLELLTGSQSDAIITADAVRFGGGMGNIARRPAETILPNRLSATDGSLVDNQLDGAGIQSEVSWKTSRVPRYMEGARYYLQYAGMPDTLVYWQTEGKNDYNDDFMSRGEWVNYLMGSPLGPQKDRSEKGLGIPVDLVLAFHTDAGVTPSDSVIGTLAIYSAQRDGGLFPDAVSRLASRDLTDMIQDQVVGDIRALHNPRWTRRAIWDRQYSEAWRPNAPAMLLELLSHQNLADMRYGLDPQFQFTVSRAIYKGILRYLAHNQGEEAIVQPLPPTHMLVERTGKKSVQISWQPQVDPLEPTSTPDYYKLYTRVGTGGFDQGRIIVSGFTELDLPYFDTIYSFRVTALNRGGESFPSEILSASFNEHNSQLALVVNGFDKVSGPGFFDSGNLAGLKWWDDLPIPMGKSVSYTGMQYDYSRSSPWLDDDSPGWGASYADMEGRVLVGNTFDNVFIHGESIRNAGLSFVSASRDAFLQGSFNPAEHSFISLIMGKQKGKPSFLNSDSIEFRVFTPGLINQLNRYLSGGGNLFLSGAYIGTDMVENDDKLAIEFAKNILGYNWRTNNACNTGKVMITDVARGQMPSAVSFNTEWHPGIYPVEAPDAIEPFGAGSKTIYRFLSNKTSACVFLEKEKYKAFSMGFPFESITDKNARDIFMKRVIQLFETNVTQEIYE